VALLTWWGFGLPYSMLAWLLDERQMRWTLICYAWEVPTAGFFGPVLFPQLWWRRIEHRWAETFDGPGEVDPAKVAAIEGMILDYPVRVGWVLFFTSIVGYLVGGLQLGLFAQLPAQQQIHVAVLGVVTGAVGGLFAFLYLEGLFAPLLEQLGELRPTVRPAGRRLTIRSKVFASSLILSVCIVLLFGTVFWNGAARVLEQQAGERLLVHARHLADTIASDGGPDGPQWRATLPRLDVGRSGSIWVVDGTGRSLTPPGRTLDGAGLRAEHARDILTEAEGDFVDRNGLVRIVAFARSAHQGTTVVLMVPRDELAQEMQSRLLIAAGIFLATLALVLTGSYLFARRLSIPIEVVTAVANRTARSPRTPWELVHVRTNDEVGELAVALNDMTTRLADATAELTRHGEQLAERVREATHNVTTLYETTRAVTSTLEIEDVLALVERHVVAALGLRGFVLLRESPHRLATDVYATGVGRRELDVQVDLDALCPHGAEPTVQSRAAMERSLPPALAGLLRGPRVLCIPLRFKERLLGAILSALDDGASIPSIPMAGALGSQIAVALANVALFETVRRHEKELSELTERQMQLREETLRDISRELHDGLGQSLTAISMDLVMLERAAARDPATRALAERIRTVHGNVGTTIQEVREMSQLLRPSMLDHLGLVPSIRTLGEGFMSRTGIALDLQLSDDMPRLASPVEVLLYRVTQEALTNIVKHSRARHVTIALALEPSQVVLAIDDDGVGLDPERLRKAAPAPGVGLVGMRERVSYYGGVIDIRSQPGKGVHIRVVIPVVAHIERPATLRGQG
jgi:signal transduction histidine kinase